MSPRSDPAITRRRFVQFLAGSPLLAHPGAPALAQSTSASSRLADPMVWAPRDLDKLISDPKDALDVFDFEPVARKNVPPAHFGYMVTGIDDEVTLRANREGFLKFQLRPRRLVDVSTVDMTTEILGATYDSPIVIAPTSSNRAFHPDGEIAVAKAAKAGNHLQILSTVATTSIEEAIAARGAPVWFQLYPTPKWEVGEALAKRAERAGSPVIALTVDGPAPPNWETLVRLRRTDTRQCDSCHGRTFREFVARKPNFDGIDLGGVTGLNAPNLTWDFVKRLRDTIKTKIVLKGILAREDAELAANYGIDGIIVSNHSGRVVDSGRDNRGLAGDHRGSWRPHASARGQRLPPGNRYYQSARHGRASGMHRAALSVGPWCLRSAGCRARARDPPQGDERRDAAGRSAVNQASHPSFGAESLSAGQSRRNSVVDHARASRRSLIGREQPAKLPRRLSWASRQNARYRILAYFGLYQEGSAWSATASD